MASDSDDDAGTGAPIEEDTRHDDLDYNTELEPDSAKAWLNLLKESEDAFEDYNDHCDKIDKQYASLSRLSQYGRDKEFQMFWANCEVMKPAIYAQAPVPVVVPKFKDRRPVYQAASELMERCCVVAFDLARINDLMLLVRDDLALLDRGVAWCRYESGKGGGSYYDHEKVCVDFKERRDFLHSISRNWREVTWVASASYLTRTEARQRFYDTSGDAYQEADYRVDKDAQNVGGADKRERAKFWEIWHKGSRRVVWVAEGVEDILDEDDAHLDLQNFFPCPKPAYGTLQRGSLVPVPDVLQYKDQLDEINLLTGRIHALSDALEVKGFYPAGGSELADAVQAAINTKTAGRVMVPISNWAAFGGTKDVVIWLPIDMIATTIQALVLLRKQLIDDIYQIVGLADIMRGDTDPNETLGAQQLKTQNGSMRVRDKQQELVRLSRDLVEITSEIITEKFSTDIMIEMSQTQLPTQKMVQQQINDLVDQTRQQITQAAQTPQGQQLVKQNPQQAQQMAQQMVQQAQQQIQQMTAQPTIEQVTKFLKDNRAKSFVLDIETDSTIMADENGEKQRRTEFVGVLSQLLPQLSAMITAAPETADFCGELLKFSVAPFRAGRALDGSINDLVELMKQKGQQQPGPDPTTAQNQTAIQIEQMKDATAQQKIRSDAQLRQDELKQQDAHKQLEISTQLRMKQMDLDARLREAKGDAAVSLAETSAGMASDQRAHEVELQKSANDIEIARQKSMQQEATHQAKMADMASRQQERVATAQLKAQQPPVGGI